MSALYNEIDPFAAKWLRNLIDAGHIAPGVVDERSIEDLTPADVAGPGQRHFFSGIGGWSYALRLAGIPDDADVWTGSCPCQPFSSAGKRGGTSDARHLWPTWFELIRECRPPTIFGEQVASRDGIEWFDLVRSDLEGCGYAVGASDLCAAGVGAPHIRQRLYFVAYELGDSSRTRSRRDTGAIPDAQAQGKGQGREPGRVADEPVDAGADRHVANANSPRLGARRSGQASDGRDTARIEPAGLRVTGVDWRNVVWLPCLDGKSRPVEPGLEPLAYGLSGRVAVRRTSEQGDTEEHEYNRAGALAGFGNAIVPQLAAVFIQAAEAARGQMTTPASEAG